MLDSFVKYIVKKIQYRLHAIQINRLPHLCWSSNTNSTAVSKTYLSIEILMCVSLLVSFHHQLYIANECVCVMHFTGKYYCLSENMLVLYFWQR